MRSSAYLIIPGDLVFTGAPAGVGVLKPGDMVEVEIDGLGVLKNPVKSE
ncbi:MAG: fumarylacetoacetate hydrolase family protein [Chloroflexota bacterium]